MKALRPSDPTPGKVQSIISPAAACVKRQSRSQNCGVLLQISRRRNSAVRVNKNVVLPGKKGRGWRSEWDSNPRVGFVAHYTISSRAPSASSDIAPRVGNCGWSYNVNSTTARVGCQRKWLDRAVRDVRNRDVGGVNVCIGRFRTGRGACRQSSVIRHGQPEPLRLHLRMAYPWGCRPRCRVCSRAGPGSQCSVWPPRILRQEFREAAVLC